jgi:hypothetical protein
MLMLQSLGCGQGRAIWAGGNAGTPREHNQMSYDLLSAATSTLHLPRVSLLLWWKVDCGHQRRQLLLLLLLLLL